MSAKNWSVYMIRCSDGSLYTGISTDVTRRLKEHMHDKTKGAKSLRGKGPLRVVHEESGLSHGDALKRELAVKKLSKQQKEQMISP
ncbi:MAG: GIY-YIG nuclease family protein [Gammaproteobacteria bacterium]|nr:GIY-YIG nuclease family protein [Gammaproteobacteria bacterium]